jgi:RNA polymerase sigma factor (sigma-70 family)
MHDDDGRRAAGAPPVEQDIHWDRARDFVRRRLSFELPAPAHGLLDDLTQECLVRLLRVVRRERVDNLEALLTVLARRTAVDALRRRSRWRALITEDETAIALAADPHARADEPGDPLERLRFVVVEYFVAHDARCRELAVAYFAGRDWKAVAVASGRSHDLIRKQWSRCLELLRAAARDERGPLFEWTRNE